MKRKILPAILVALLGLLVLLTLLGCRDDGGHAEPPPAPDPCAGPVPCLTLWWTWPEYFVDHKGDSVSVYSGGWRFYVNAWIQFPEDEYYITFAGDVIDCYNGKVDSIIYPPWVELDPPCENNECEAEGKLLICDEILTITELYEYRTETFWDDITAKYY